MNEGRHVEKPDDMVVIGSGNSRLTLKYRVLKHIVEQRKRDGYLAHEIVSIFSDVLRMLSLGEYAIVPNKKEPGAFLFVEKALKKRKGVVLGLELVSDEDDGYFIKTGFYRTASKMKKLIQ